MIEGPPRSPPLSSHGEAYSSRTRKSSSEWRQLQDRPRPAINSLTPCINGASWETATVCISIGELRIHKPSLVQIQSGFQSISEVFHEVWR